MGHSQETASLMTTVFWALFAMSRLIIAPLFCWLFNPSSCAFVIAGSLLAAMATLLGAALPANTVAVLAAIGGLAIGVGPSYSMTIAMVKQHTGLSSMDSAFFSIAASVGSGFMPFAVSQVLDLIGPLALFPMLSIISAVMFFGASLLGCYLRCTTQTAQESLKLMEEGTSVAVGDAITPQAQKPKIWMMWAQGWDKAPLICRVCAASWEHNNPDFDVVKLDDRSISMWLPELRDETCFIWNVSPVKRSDYIRLKLLAEHGGIWADSTSLSTGSIADFLQENAGADEFFVFDRNNSAEWPCYDPFANEGLQLSNWFFISLKPGHALMVQASENYKQVMRLEQSFGDEPYFAMHGVIQKSDVWKTVKQRMPSISSGYPHIVEFGLHFLAPPTSSRLEVLDEALAHAPVQKLSHKVLKDDFIQASWNMGLLEKTVVGYLFQKAFGEDAHEVLRNEVGLSSQTKVTLDVNFHHLHQEELQHKHATYEAWPGLCGPIGRFGMKQAMDDAPKHDRLIKPAVDCHCE
jgi:hypothetical protein